VYKSKISYLFIPFYFSRIFGDCVTSVSYEKLASIYQQQKQISKAIAQYKKSLVISKRLANLDKNNADWQRGLAVPLGQLMGLYAQNNQQSLAIASGEQALAILKQLQQQGKLHGRHKT
jgi:tetratricopeptide (TPR) repeat protein